jgi:hypothetical protein
MDYFTPRFTDLITGSVCGFVRLEYKVRYLDHQGVMQSAVYVEDFSISNCGKLGPWFIFGED